MSTHWSLALPLFLHLPKNRGILNLAFSAWSFCDRGLRIQGIMLLSHYEDRGDTMEISNKGGGGFIGFWNSESDVLHTMGL